MEVALKRSKTIIQAVSSGKDRVFSGYISSTPVQYHSATGAHGILMLSPWGIEELCSRKAYRVLAEQMAELGHPVMRFDFPGTADSGKCISSNPWLTASINVLRRFIEMNNLASVTLVAQGCGALIAARLAALEQQVSDLVFLSPASSGRLYLRELSAWSALMTEIYRDGVVKDADGNLRAAGCSMPIGIQEELKQYTLAKDLSGSSFSILLLSRPNYPGDEQLATHLSDGGLNLIQTDFGEYTTYVGNPTLSKLPIKAMGTIRRWIADRHAGGNDPEAESNSLENLGTPELERRLSLGAVYEEPIRFGEGRNCFGVVTVPENQHVKTGYIFLNSGYDHHVGWGRCHVEFARKLASDGYLSLRIDASGVGESDLHEGQDPQILYSKSQIGDVSAAVDVLNQRGVENIIVVGRCSGAYLAFLAGELEGRISALLMVNTRRFAWDPRQVVEEEIRKPIQPLDNYKRKLKDWSTIRRALSSRRSFQDALSKLLRGVYRPLKRYVERNVGSFSISGRLIQQVHGSMRKITQSGTRVVFVFSDDDMGLTELDYYFGSLGRDLNTYQGADVKFIANADHNLTSQASRQSLFEILQDTAIVLSPGKAVSETAGEVKR